MQDAKGTGSATSPGRTNSLALHCTHTARRECTLVSTSTAVKTGAKRLVWNATNVIRSDRPLTLLLDRHHPVPLYRPADDIDPILRQALTEQIEARQDPERARVSRRLDIVFRSMVSREYVVRVDSECTVDPWHGWAVTGRGQLLQESHFLAPMASERVGRELFSSVPSPGWWLQARRHPTAQFEAAVSLLDSVATNYAHFLDIIINRVRLVDAVGVPSDVPLLVSRELAMRPFFGQVMRYNDNLRQRVTIVDGPVNVRTLYLAHPSMDSIESYNYARSLVPISADAGEERLLLLRRNAANGRGFANEDEVVAACSRFGFVSYDPAEDSIVQQAERFAKATHVVSAHGAGLANLMFNTSSNLSVLELFHSGTIRDHFFILANHYGNRYTCLVGDAAGPIRNHDEMNRVNFFVDIPQLVEKLAYVTGQAR